MSDAPTRPHRRLALLGRFQAFVYAAHTRHFLGARLSRWLLALPLVAALAAFWYRWPTAVLYGLLTLFFLLNLLFALIRRRGYKTFRPGPADHPAEGASPPAPNERVPLYVTGPLASQQRELYLFDRGAAAYWRLPLGEHGLMARAPNGVFLYQFFEDEDLESVVAGDLITRRQPRPALAVAYWTTWLPHDNDVLLDAFRRRDGEEPRRVKRTLYLGFEDETQRTAVWRSLVADERAY